MRGRMTAMPSADIFKAYDIRGLYGEQIDGDVAERIGRAFARVLVAARGQARARSCASGCGRDMRLSAPELSARYREGLLQEGVHVIDAGHGRNARCSTSSSARASSTAG